VQRCKAALVYGHVSGMEAEQGSKELQYERDVSRVEENQDHAFVKTEKKSFLRKG
jgi:hypothetical protein